MQWSGPFHTSIVLITGLSFCLCADGQGQNAKLNPSDERFIGTGRPIGTWFEDGSVLSIVLGEILAAPQYIRHYVRWDFYKDGALQLTTAFKVQLSTRKFHWRTYRKDGSSFLELSDDKGIYLLARYEFKGDDVLWIAFDPHPKRVRTQPPKTFDVFQEPSILLIILERQKPKARPQ